LKGQSAEPPVGYTFFDMPEIATSWEQFTKVLGARGLASRGCVG
jgi:hypothetical protein